MEQALADLDAMRVREGDHLRADLDGRKLMVGRLIERLARAAGSPQGESWVAAQQALSAAQAARGPTTRALGDIDGLAAAALEQRGIYVRIGAENTMPALRTLSLVAANYGLPQRNLGTVSLIGPTRMDYGQAIRTVSEAASQLSRFVEDVYEQG